MSLRVGNRYISCRLLPGLLVAVGAISGCGPLQWMDGPESDMLRRFRTGAFELVLSAELVELRKDAATGRSTGRYQLYSRGTRTWRLDTATGESCLVLTTETDWKRPDTKASSCNASQ
jgi:hypothetical protein